MLRMSLVWFSLFCFAGLANAQIPKLSRGMPTSCRVNLPATEWLPSRNDIAALERALPGYLASHALTKERMPTADVEYARQYSGIVRHGKKYILGRFYPESDARPSFAKAGDCWLSEDGGRRHWRLVFDLASGKIISHAVNGIG